MRPLPRSPGTTPRSWLAIALALALTSGWQAAPNDSAGATAETRDEVASAAGIPSVQYLHAAAHAGDVIAFDPGGPVTVPFSPRVEDAWAVDGAAPQALPAGRATGGELEAVDRPPTIDVPGAELVSVPFSRDGLRREVFGFLPYWQLSDPDTVLDWQTLSTVAYFSVGCTSSGALAKRNPDGSLTTGWAGWTSARMTQILEAAHRNHTRVVLTVSCFAWSANGAVTQANLLSSGAARARLARQIAAAVRDRGADGVNLDFEPIVPGYAAAFVKLVRAVRAELDAIAPGYQLTFDAMGIVGSQPIAEATAPGGADAVLIMGYDYRTENAAVAGSIDPLAGPAYDLTDTVEAFTALVDPSKVILGVPYYGRAWSTPDDSLHAPNLSGAGSGGAAEPTYVQALALAEIHGRRWDPVEHAPWTAYRREICSDTGCVTTWRQTYYDDARSLSLRYDLVNRSNLRGVGIWALGYDGQRPELRAALAAAFASDRPGPDAGIPIFRVVVNGLRLRATPSTSAHVWFRFKAGDVLRVIGEPVSAEGYAWFPVVGTVRQSGALDAGEVQGWVAAYGNGYTHVEPRVPTSYTPPA